MEGKHYLGSGVGYTPVNNEHKDWGTIKGVGVVGIYRPMPDSTLSTRGTKRGVLGVKWGEYCSTWVLYDTLGVGGCPGEKKAG